MNNSEASQRAHGIFFLFYPTWEREFSLLFNFIIKIITLVNRIYSALFSPSRSLFSIYFFAAAHGFSHDACNAARKQIGGVFSFSFWLAMAQWIERYTLWDFQSDAISNRVQIARVDKSSTQSLSIPRDYSHSSDPLIRWFVCHRATMIWIARASAVVTYCISRVNPPVCLRWQWNLSAVHGCRDSFAYFLRFSFPLRLLKHNFSVDQRQHRAAHRTPSKITTFSWWNCQSSKRSERDVKTVTLTLFGRSTLISFFVVSLFTAGRRRWIEFGLILHAMSRDSRQRYKSKAKINSKLDNVSSS